MKAVLLLCGVILAVALPAVANAQPGNGCDQIAQNINNAAAAITDNANSYWAHRANFVSLIYGRARLTTPNPTQAAEQEKSQADPKKAGMPGRLNSLKGLLTAAQAQHCIFPDELSAVIEPTIKVAKRVNFDQFPPETELEEPAAPGPPRMPTH
jgi:hypothetical protein